MGYFLYGHGGSADHSSEDRIRGLCRLLPDKPELYSACPEEDWRYGLGRIAGLYRDLPGAMEEQIRTGDVLLSARPCNTDGLRRRGGRTVIWGWSVDTQALRKPVVRELSRCEAVVVTEKRSFDALCAAGLEKKARLGPDPAFLVERRIRPLRGAFRQDTVGLCFGAEICRYEGENGLLYRSYCRLIRYILEETSFQIALIPYCAKARCSDCVLFSALEQEFGNTGRIFRREDGDCRVLRGDLSLCRCCVGSAGAVAAWSCGVPALCLGAAPRALGLSRELFGGWQEAVVPIASLKREEELSRCFRCFLSREGAHRRRLEREAPLRRQQALSWTWADIA